MSFLGPDNGFPAAIGNDLKEISVRGGSSSKIFGEHWKEQNGSHTTDMFSWGIRDGPWPWVMVVSESTAVYAAVGESRLNMPASLTPTTFHAHFGQYLHTFYFSLIVVFVYHILNYP